MNSGSAVVQVSVNGLKPHEEIVDSAFRILVSEVTRDGGIHTPILIDRVTGTILDGHHRVRVAQYLGLTTIPAILVDYMNDRRIAVESWRDGEVVCKHDVVRAAATGKLMPPKTSRHLVVQQAA